MSGPLSPPPVPRSRPERLVGTTRLILALCCVSTFGAQPACTEEPTSPAIDFARDIRPILSENCVFCHGPDEATREADLRLDESEGAWSVIEKQSPDESELLRRLVTDDPDERMPPPESNRKLKRGEIELIRGWIEQGALWETHWSFRPIRYPNVPEVADVRDTDQAGASRSGAAEADAVTLHNPIDHFIQSKLPARGLAPSPQAPRATLIRRLSLDLTGLPPTPEQVRAFEADRSNGAYERLVDRLLDSPAYGERMAWDWLDAARYADTNGYQGDRERTMWPWRDWVVKAFNDNMPYDQFTVWQLAGDLLPNATTEQKLATGFCRNHMINGEGGRIAEENRVEYVMDMSETMGTVWLGLTLNCCRCHDHKYDPITNEEYYQLFAFFNQTPVKGNGGDPQTAPNLAVPTDAQASELESVTREIATLEMQMSALSKSLVSQQPTWEATELKRLESETEWKTLHAEKVYAKASRVRSLKDGSVLTAGEPPANDTYTFFAKTDLKQVTGIRLEALKHATLPSGSLSFAGSGNFVLTEIEVSQVASQDDESAKPFPMKSAAATFEQGGHPVVQAFDGDSNTGWAVWEGRLVDREHTAVFRFSEPIEVEPDGLFRVVLRHDSPHERHNLGRFRLALSGTDEPKLVSGDDELRLALAKSSDSRSDAEAKMVGRAHRRSNSDYKSMQNKRDALVKRRDSISRSLPKVMVMAEMEQPRETFVLDRGLYNKPTTKVAAGLPEFLPLINKTSVEQKNLEKKAETEPSLNRLDLARWLVDPRHPLTARVTVNRFWQQVFGIGLVKTTEDFGAQGEIPEHVELLDWLAKSFQDSGWNVKELMRLMVTSHTYRQSSKIVDADQYAVDPNNRLLSRAPRYRLASWMLRDQALAASGLLSPVRGGPAVNTYQPAGVWEEASFGKKAYQQDEGEKLYRRSLYAYWRRIIAPTMFFDNASRQTCTVKVSRTNTPLHALQTLNNIAYVEAARVLATQILQSNPLNDDSTRIDEVMMRVLGRNASPTEQEILLAGLNRNLEQIRGKESEAKALLSVGESQWDETLEPMELAAWTNLCLAVLNLDETLNHE